MTEVVRSYISDGIGLVELATVLVVGVVVLVTWGRTRSIIATAGAMLVGALVVGYVMNAEWFGQRMGEDIQRRENGLQVLAGGVPLAGLDDVAWAWARFVAQAVPWFVALLAAWLVVKVWHLDAGSPHRAITRGLVRARWQSVARSSGLAVVRDRGGALGAGAPSLGHVLTGDLTRRQGGQQLARRPPVERLPRLRAGHASPDRLTVTWRVTPARGQTVEDVADKAQALADGLGVDRVVVRRVGPAAGELTAYLGDRFAEAQRWEPVLVEAGIPWGADEHGKVCVFPLGQGHGLVAGATGSGKSAVVNALVASCAVRPDVALLGVDLKRVELGPWRERFTDLAVDPAHAARLVAEVADEVRRRYCLLEAAGLRRMTSPADIGVPWVVVVIDELSELLDSIDRGDVISIGRLARACGISLLVATQRPTAKTLSADLRDQLDVMRWCGRCPPSSTTGEMVLGDAVKVLDPSSIDRARRGLGVLDDVDGTRLARAWWLSDAHVAQVARGTAHLRIPREHVLVAEAVSA